MLIIAPLDFFKFLVNYYENSVGKLCLKMDKSRKNYEIKISKNNKSE